MDAEKDAMAGNSNLRAPPATPSLPAKPSMAIWLTGLFFRELFIVVLMVVTVRVAHPQIESIWSAYETSGDLIRMLLGLAVCIWLFVHLFILPKDDEGYRTWLYLGLTVLPLAVFCAIAIW
jgi:hypothetical protein